MFPIVQNVQVYLKDQGAGTPTLFLHGNPDSADLWDAIITQLKPHYRCLAPDLPSFGRSVAPAHFDPSFENLGRFVEELLEAVGIHEPVNLVTHDYGGAFGMAWAAQYPHKVRQLVVMNHPFFISGYRWHSMAKIWRIPVLGELSLLTMNWSLFHKSMQQGSRKLTEAQMRQMYQYLTPATKRMILRLYRVAPETQLAAWEPRMLRVIAQVPTLVLWGDHDPYLPLWMADRFGAQEVQHFPESGHWLPAEEPEQVAEALLRFFSQHQDSAINENTHQHSAIPIRR